MLINADLGGVPPAPINLTPRREAAPPGLVIGLVNLMPRTAMRATEAQFRTLIEGTATAGQAATRLRLFTAADPQTSSNVVSLGQTCEPLEALWSAKLGGLIVTGTEPAAHAMTQEPAWPILAKLVDWAAYHTVSTIWSCFSAHAAVYRQDGIARHRLPEKLSGVYGSMRAGTGDAFRGVPRHWSIPHSRYNTLSEPDLRRAGYTILMHAPRVGADIFTKRCGNSQFLYFQGHPEYGPKTLLGEYLRDVKRFAAGQSQSFPKRPSCRFDAETIKLLNGLQERAMTQPAAALLPALDAIPSSSIEHGWREPARQFYAGWLNDLAARKTVHGRATP
jgi:homoserine O-succinyltransferase